jgi:hypothetical protein
MGFFEEMSYQNKKKYLARMLVGNEQAKLQ